MPLWATAFVSGAFLLRKKPIWAYLCYVLSMHLSQLLIYQPWWRHTCICCLMDVHLSPGLVSVPWALWHLWPSFPQGWGGWTQLPRDCRAAWSPDSKICPSGGSNVDCIMVVATLDIKCKCCWRDKYSRKQKGQVQRCLFSAAGIFAYPKGNMLKKTPNYLTTARETQPPTLELH